MSLTLFLQCVGSHSCDLNNKKTNGGFFFKLCICIEFNMINIWCNFNKK